MPIHKVQAPDGSIIKVEAPDEATQQQIIDFAQQHYQDKKATSSGIGQGIKNFVAGAIKGASQIGSTLLAPVSGAEGTYFGNSMPSEQRRQQVTGGLQDMGADPNSLYFKGGELGAEIAGTAGMGGVLAKGASAIPMLAKFAPAIASGGMNLGDAKTGSMLVNALIRGGAGSTLGATQAGLINPSMAPTGAVIGGALPIGVSIAGATGRAVRGFVKPQIAATDILAEAAGGKDALMQAIQKAQSDGKTMSGLPFTLGQAGKNAGIAATERSRYAANPEAFQNIYEAQRNARINSLLNIAKDPETVQAAIDARNTAAQSMYNPAFDQTMLIPKTGISSLNELAKNPVIQAAKKDAYNLAASFPGGDIGDPMNSVKGLHYMKLAIDSQLNKPVANTALGNYSHAALTATKKSLMSAIDEISPAYTDAAKQYALMSKPINQMQVGQKLMDTLVGPATQYGAEPGQRMAAFYRALDNAPAMIKRETGMSMPIEKVLTTEQYTAVQNIAKELAKDTDLQNLGRGIGSDTAQKLARQNMISNISSLATHNRLSRTAQAVNLVARLLREGKNLRTNSYVDTMLQNPDIAAQAVQNMPASSGNFGLLGNPVLRALPIAAGSN